MGAWVETRRLGLTRPVDSVAPLVGAWVETPSQPQTHGERHVAPLVGAWVETHQYDAHVSRSESRPSWARGLKLTTITLTLMVSCRAPRGRVG